MQAPPRSWRAFLATGLRFSVDPGYFSRLVSIISWVWGAKNKVKTHGDEHPLLLSPEKALCVVFRGLKFCVVINICVFDSVTRFVLTREVWWRLAWPPHLVQIILSGIHVGGTRCCHFFTTAAGI